MGPDLINGIPAHVLFVHFVVILVPLTALALILCAALPSVMRRFGLALPALALVSLISVPLTTNAVRKHTELGEELLPWVVALFLAATAVWWFYHHTAHRTPEAGDPPARWPSRCASPQRFCPSSSESARAYRCTESASPVPKPPGTTPTPPPRTPTVTDRHPSGAPQPGDRAR